MDIVAIQGFIQTIKNDKDILLTILGLVGGAGILGGLAYVVNRRDDRLIQQGRGEVQQGNLQDRTDQFAADKALKEDIAGKPLAEIQFFNQYKRWPTVPECAEYKRTGMWPVPKETT
jgi:hypothetical protein